MGSLFGGTMKSTSDQKPWEPQGTALKDIFAKASSIYNQQAGTPFYQGDLYATMDPGAALAVQNWLNYAQNRGAENAAAVSDAGKTIANPEAFKSATNSFAAAAGADPTQANIANAKAYAANPAIDGMIDAASRDVTRNLYEQEIPGINRAATGTGNINSTRAGVAQAIAERGAADRVADISSTIRGDAYNRGLALSEGARTSNLSAMGQSAGLYGQQLGMGLDALAQGNQMATGNFAGAIDAATLLQKDRQGQMDADYMRWQGQDGREMDLLGRYYGIVGANNWGGTTTQTQKQQGSILGSLLGIASTAASFSDPRLKENVRKVGELEDGLGVYEYDYIWGEPAVGVMADEVADLRPWALGRKIAGFQTVNYAAL